MKWSSQEQQTAFQMRKEGKTLRAIGEILNRHPDVVGRFFQRKRDGRKNKVAIAILREEQEQRVIVPEFVLAERDRRLSSPMTLSMLIFGDPRYFQHSLFKLTGQQTA